MSQTSTGEGIEGGGAGGNYSWSATGTQHYGQSADFSRSHSLAEQGSYAGGSYALSSVAYSTAYAAHSAGSMTATESDSGTSFAATDSKSGSTSASENFSESRLGTYANGSFSYASVTLAGGSTSHDALDDHATYSTTDAAGTTDFHGRADETVSYSGAGTRRSGPPGK